MKRNLTVNEDVLFWAFRYALGRMTYSVGDVCNAIKANLHLLTDKTKSQMINEIDKAAKQDRLGMSMDKKQWMEVYDHLVVTIGIDRQ